MRPPFCLCLLVATLALTACGEADTDPVEIERTRRVAQHDPRLGATSEERFGRSGTPGADSPAADPAPAPFTYQLPPGWRAIEPTMHRAINLVTPEGAEAYLSLTRGGPGAVRDNVRRWRVQQLGLPPLDDTAFAALPRVPMLGGEAVLIEASGSFTGMGGGTAQGGWAIHGLVLQRGERVITVKLVGPEEAVRSQHEALLAFADSLAERGR